MTTNESINFKRYKHFKDKDGNYSNPFYTNWKINLLEFFHIIPIGKEFLEADDDNETMYETSLIRIREFRKHPVHFYVFRHMY